MMGNNRYQKTTPQPVDYTPRQEKKVEEVTLDFNPCLVCNKPITEGYYGRYEKSGVCCKSCNAIYQNTRRSLIDYVIPTKETK